MILIVGGREQGKLAFALQLCAQLKDWDCPPVADGRADEFKNALEASVINHLECFVRRLMKGEEGEDSRRLEKNTAQERGDALDAFIGQLINVRNDVVIIADEIGSGIVPADPFEREYRETAGRICQRIAAASDAVYRVVCGIGMRIK